MATNSLFRLEIEGVDPPSSPYTEFVKARVAETATFPDGNADDQVNKVIRNDVTIAISGTSSLDLKTAADAFGVAIAATDVCIFDVFAADANTANIEMKPNAVNGWTNFFATGSVLKLPAGTGITIRSFDTTGYPVTATNKVVDFTNTSGATTNAISILVLARG